jgi:hypothetical protein
MDFAHIIISTLSTKSLLFDINRGLGRCSFEYRSLSIILVWRGRNDSTKGNMGELSTNASLLLLDSTKNDAMVIIKSAF